MPASHFDLARCSEHCGEFSDFWPKIETESMRILVVEDEHRMAALLRQGLMDDGHAVCAASNGADGFSIASTNAFDLILVDVMLPAMSGLEIA